MASLIILALVSYLSGSIPFGKIVGYGYGIDIQKAGSGNIGFANVYRTLGIKPAFLVLLCDVLKGYIPTVISLFLKFSIFEVFLIGTLSITGHILPIWLTFKGGKGVATGLGVLIALSPKLAIVGIFIWFVVLTLTKIFSLASLSGAWTVLLLSTIFPTTRIYTAGILFIVTFGTIRHIENIKRIILGTEPKSWKW